MFSTHYLTMNGNSMYVCIVHVLHAYNIVGSEEMLHEFCFCFMVAW